MMPIPLIPPGDSGANQSPVMDWDLPCSLWVKEFLTEVLDGQEDKMRNGEKQGEE
jgi:hypothetical protein